MTRDRFAALAILIVGAALRLYDLTLKPFHHDEGVNGFFMTRLVREHVYKYDPANYHGPSLYYFTLPLTRIFGFESFALRLLPALFGIGVLVLVLYLGKRLGSRAALWAAALLAVSPGMVYISRYYIHEMMVVFFTLGIVVGVVWYAESMSMWRLFAIAASAGCLFATKETAAPMVVVLLIAWGCTWAVMKLTANMTRAARERESRRKRRKKDAAAEEPVVAELDPDPPHRNAALLMWALVVFVGINAVLYSSFYTNPDGLKDALRSLLIWKSTGETAHVHPFMQYVKWMLYEEPAVLLLGFVGIGFAFARRTNALAVFCAFWSCGMLLMYSIIGYKTPWLQVNIVLPFAIMSGWALQEIYGLGIDPLGEGEEESDFSLYAGASALIGIGGLALSAGLCLSLNFVKYDENKDEYVYIYAHTVRDVNRLLRDVDTLAARAKGPDTSIPIIAREYWPLPWNLKDYKGAQFFGRMPAPPTTAQQNDVLRDAQMIVAEQGQQTEILARTRGLLQPVGKYVLRPGVDLVLWARTSLGKPDEPAPPAGASPPETPAAATSGAPAATASGAPAATASGAPASTASGAPATSRAPAATASGPPAATTSGAPAATASGAPAATASGAPAATASRAPAATASGTPAATASGPPAATASGAPSTP